MSTLQVTTIQNTSGGSSRTTDQLYSGSAKAWVNFNGGGASLSNQTIRSSFNVTSVYKNATGIYTVNFTSSLFSNANYTTVIGASQPSAQSTNKAYGFVDSNYLSGSVQILNISSNGGNSDAAIVCVSAFS